MSCEDIYERTCTLPPSRSAGVRLPKVPLFAGTSGHATPPLFVCLHFHFHHHYDQQVIHFLRLENDFDFLFK